MNIDGYSTHQPLLLAAIAATDGDILELGGGWYSTLLLSAIANAGNRRAYTFETSENVFGTLKPLETGNHSVELIPGFEMTDNGVLNLKGLDHQFYLGIQERFLSEFWERLVAARNKLSVVFVDQAPWFLRAPSIRFFANKAEYIVVHDAEAIAFYGLEPTVSSFQFRWDTEYTNRILWCFRIYLIARASPF
jgi:hypothetical protein